MSTTLPLVAGTGADTIGRDAPSMDEETFRSLYARIASPLRAYLLRLSGDPALSDDLLQDTFVRLLQGRVPPMDPVGQKRYLFRIATNLLHDHHRRWWRWGSELPDLSVTGPGPEIDQRTDVRRVMALMKPRERQLLWLAYVEGFSHVEIAEIVGCAPQACGRCCAGRVCSRDTTPRRVRPGRLRSGSSLHPSSVSWRSWRRCGGSGRYSRRRPSRSSKPGYSARRQVWGSSSTAWCWPPRHCWLF